MTGSHGDGWAGGGLTLRDRTAAYSAFWVIRPIICKDWVNILKTEVMKENNKTTCDPCEENFKHKVNELVKEGHAPSHMARQKREHEVKSAFGHTAGRTDYVEHIGQAPTAKPHAKEHAVAGGTKKK